MADSSETLERRFRRVYSQAHKELTAELNAYIARYRKEERLMKERLAKKQITPEEYESWLRRKVFQGKQWRGKVNQMTSTLANSNQAALDIIRGYQMNVFADGANREAFEIERMTKGGKIDADMGIDFTLYNADTVERLIAEEPELLPRKQLATGKDKAWNQKKIANAVTQGIIQGNSIDEIAKRIAKNTASDDMKAMTRYARTAVTSAQNAGRMETMHRAQEMGITVQKQWLATLDKRTRDSHRHLDGQVQELNKPFKSDFGEIMYPGDPTAAPGDVYNCRCTLVSVYPQYNSVIQPGERFERLDGMSYEEWKEGKRKQNKDVAGSSLKEKLDKVDKKEEKEGYRADRYDAELIEAEKKIEEIRKNGTYSELIKLSNETVEKYGIERTAREAQKRGIEWVQPKRLAKPNDRQAIIQKLGGGDKTKGSCASLGFAYAGQLAGYDIVDFRGGKSQDLFSWDCRGILRTLRSEGANVITGKGKSFLTAGKRALAQIQEGKEYYYECAKHAAIVRKIDGKYQYLELQHANDSGWKPFSENGLDSTLRWRFGASRTSYRVEIESMLLDVEEMAQNERFLKLLGYINTRPGDQKKGVGGGIK